MVNIAVLLGADIGTAQKDMANVFELDTKLAQVNYSLRCKMMLKNFLVVSEKAYSSFCAFALLFFNDLVSVF